MLGGGAEKGGLPLHHRIDLEIMDRLVERKCHVWGRNGKRALQLLDDADIDRGVLDHRKNELQVDNGSGVAVYSDLHFCGSEIDLCWPDAKKEAATQAQFDALRAQAAKPKLTEAERERVTRSILSLLDFLNTDCESLLSPLRAVLKWKQVIEGRGARALLPIAGEARQSLKKLVPAFDDAIQPHMTELGLVSIRPSSNSDAAREIEVALHSIANIAMELPEKSRNHGAFLSAGLSYERSFGQLNGCIEQIKVQLVGARRELAEGNVA